MKYIPFLLLVSVLAYGCISHSEQKTQKEKDSASFEYSLSEDDTAGCGGQNFEVEKRKIGIGKAKSASLSISIPAGILAVKGGADDLLEAAVKYHTRERRFLVTQQLDDDHLTARISMPKLEGLKEINNERTICSVRLNSTIPMDLDIKLGAGKGKFDLSSLNLGQADLSLGAGEFTINLAGTNANGLKVDAGVGKATVDLSGEKKKDLDAEFNCGIGDLTLILPTNSGVRVSLSGLAGNIDAGDLVKKGAFYYNEAWDKKGSKVRIEINGGMGNVTLEMK